MVIIRHIILLILLPLCVEAQRWEIGLAAGGANYLGDMAPTIVLFETKSSYGFVVKKNIDPYFSHNFSIMRGSISGNDQNFSFLSERNLSFFSEITEFAYIFEFNFFRFAIGLHPNKFTPFTFIGLASFYHQPKTIHDATTIILGPLDTEGVFLNTTRKGYKNLQLSIPMGGGFKWKLSPDLIMAVNMGFRYTFTDYLDDVSTIYYNIDDLRNKYGDLSVILSDRSESTIGFHGKQRGRSDMNDWYIFSCLSLTFRIKNKVCFEF